jgi:iron complex outermembrane receptor protein
MPGEVFDLSGSEVANSPEWSGTIGYQHSFFLSNGGVVTARGQSKISDGYWATTEKHLENAWQGSYTRTDASISYTAPNEVWFASVWVKNIEDDYQKTTIMPLYRMMISDPLTYGVNFTYRW